MKKVVYLDYNAAAPVRPEVIAAVAQAMAETGNASSVHHCGRTARRLVEEARENLAAAINTRAARIVFTSGGTEANNLAFKGSGRTRFLVSATEHDSVLAVAPDAALIPVQPSGLLNLDALDQLLGQDASDCFVSVMMANNETGVIQPIEDILALCHKRGALFHCDAVQAFGKLPIDLMGLPLDFMTLSSHKIGGPQGVGALVLGKGIEVKAQQKGGGQERRRRGGSENVAGIHGFGVAVRLLMESQGLLPGGLSPLANPETSSLDLAAVQLLRDNLENRILAVAPHAGIHGKESPRLPNTTSLSMPGVPSDIQLMALDLQGIAVSSGSACSSGKVQASHVLKAMGVCDAEAGSVLRISLGWQSSQQDVDLFLEQWLKLYEHKGRKQPVSQVSDPQQKEALL